MAVIKIQGSEERSQHIHYIVDTSLPPLGVGGMGQVFRGKRIEELTGVTTDVAVKFLFDDLGEAAIERSRREAAIQIDSENLVKMYGFIQIDEHTPQGIHPRYHVVSELLSGVMLLDLLNGKLNDSDGNEVAFARQLYEQYQKDRYSFAIYIVKNMLSGIMALHDKGFIHRDIDPSNVMITSDGKVKIIDFGISKKLNSVSSEQHLTTAGQFMGKAAYAAPELVLGDVGHQNETTDIYAIGIVLFELIAGKLPFDGSVNDVLEKQLKEKLPLEEISSKPLRKVIGKATEKKQADRYQSAAEFRVSVEQLERIHDNGKKTKPSFTDILRNKKYLIAAAALIAVVIGSMVALQGGETNEKAAVMTQSELAQLRTQKMNEIIDDINPISVKDSLTGVTVKSAGLLTNEALKMLEDTARAKDAIALLDKIIANGKKSSARAAYIKGIFYLKEGRVPRDLAAWKAAAQTFIKSNDSMAHTYYVKAVELDSTFYPALFELATDYYNGELRGVKVSDKVKAESYFNKALGFAQKAGDSVYVKRCNNAIAYINQ